MWFSVAVAMNCEPHLPNRLTRVDVARHLACSISTVIRYEDAGLLTSHRSGPRMVRFWPADVIAFETARKNGKFPKNPMNSSYSKKRNIPGKAAQ